jgi:hypothetical protein
MAMVGKVLVRNIGGNDMKTQAKFVAEPCQTAA